MIYLDNAATSFPKPRCVVDEVKKCITCYCGNPGRSSHKLATKAAEKIFETRVSIANFLGYEKCENIVFTPNATCALNLVIKGLVNRKCHCIISDLEHNSVLRPLYKSIQKFNGTYSIFDTSIDLRNAILPLIKSDTRIIISTLCSNVTGKSIDFDTLSQIAKEYNLKLIVDASQYLGHVDLNLSGKYFSALCSAGHKSLFGIQGSGFAIINEPELMDTILEGGSGIDSFSETMPIELPERYEAGTLATPAIASLCKGIEFISQIGINNIEKHLLNLSALLQHELSSISDLKIYGADNGILSFNVKNIKSSQIAQLLNEHNIAVRSGFHCSPLIHKKLGTEKQGAVRVSLSYFNCENEIYTLRKTLLNI